ncbi:MAG TPA: hypothetical protein VM369_11750, partial [Candidatus Binatia bacterium]|nr:hypothetical protein [Candidatus Binatia bacterium]
MMNRSEVAVKPVGEQKLKGIAEPVRLYRVPQRMGQRLMAVGADVAPAAEDVLPYGGMHLVECTDTRPAWVGTLRERLQDATVEADPRRLRLAALALLLVLSVALDVWYFTGSGDNETQPGAMTAAVPPPPDPQIARNRAASRIARQAHAQLAGGHPGEAAAAYARAIELNPLLAADARTAADLVGCLGFGTESATPLIRKYFNPVLRDELSRRTSQPGALGRQRAIELLTDVGQPRAIDRTGALLEDLKDAETCNARREVVKKLRAQRDPRALPALKATLQGGLGGWIANLCLRADAEAAVREIEQPRGARAKNRTAG